jgi:hypothetical protein
MTMLAEIAMVETMVFALIAVVGLMVVVASVAVTGARQSGDQYRRMYFLQP